MTISARSLKALDGVHPDLVRVITKADEMGARFVVTEGLRSLQRQRMLVDTGKSRTLKSRHLSGHAVDVVPEIAGGISWEPDDFRPLAAKIKEAAAACNVPIEWGGDWKSFIDMPHFQLPTKDYPDQTVARVVDVPVPAPAAPLAKSGTVWGTVTGALAAAGAWAESWLSGLIEWASKLSELGPAQSALASVGGNVKAIMLGLGAGAAVYVISRRIKASQEGKPG